MMKVILEKPFYTRDAHFFYKNANGDGTTDVPEKYRDDLPKGSKFVEIPEPEFQDANEDFKAKVVVGDFSVAPDMYAAIKEQVLRDAIGDQNPGQDAKQEDTGAPVPKEVTEAKDLDVERANANAVAAAQEEANRAVQERQAKAAQFRQRLEAEEEKAKSRPAPKGRPAPSRTRKK